MEFQRQAFEADITVRSRDDDGSAISDDYNKLNSSINMKTDILLYPLNLGYVGPKVLLGG